MTALQRASGMLAASGWRQEPGGHPGGGVNCVRAQAVGKLSHVPVTSLSRPCLHVPENVPACPVIFVGGGV
jgi:hypothetical protein